MSSRGRNPRREPGRRGVLGAALALALLPVSARLGHAHTPYRQWRVYRKRHLLIVASRTDPAAFEAAAALAQALAEHLPESKARPSRAPSLERVASLIASKQMDVAVLTPAQAAALRDGRAAFHGAGALALRALFATAGHLLVCRADFPAAHAYLVVQALDRRRAALAPLGARAPDPAQSPVPLHEGARAYLEGGPPPGQAALGRAPGAGPEADPPRPPPPKP